MRAAFPRKICFGRVAQKKPYGKSLHAVSPCRDLRFVSKPLQLPLKLVRNVAETDFAVQTFGGIKCNFKSLSYQPLDT